MKIKIVNKSKNPLPKYATDGSAGFDLYANNFAPIILIPGGGPVAVPTGLYVEIPMGYELQIRPRSGLAFKHGITVVNSPGTIDSDYRGEIMVGLTRLTLGIEDGNQLTFSINSGDRIAQAVLKKVERAEFIEVEELSNTERGEGGFGSTGK